MTRLPSAERTRHLTNNTYNPYNTRIKISSFRLYAHQRFNFTTLITLLYEAGQLWSDTTIIDLFFCYPRLFMGFQKYSQHRKHCDDIR